VKDPSSFRQALIAAYQENPCQVLPNALWKSILWDEQFETHFSVEAGEVTQLIAFGPDRLMLYWDQDRRSVRLPLDQQASWQFTLLHKDFEGVLNLEDFSHCELYFRLIHRMEAIPADTLPQGFSFVKADPQAEAREIADLISNCYGNIRLTPETVQGWQQHPVFDPQLWVWITDEAQNAPAALGIAEFYPMIDEGSLEWIQVLPDYRGRGLGQQLVFELLNRLKGRATFTTVAGQVDNPTHPERLYRRCGFEGDDLWWVLRR
jgi:GNAT superfamily N-acetyltransferase